jgi:hypothetical protein
MITKKEMEHIKKSGMVVRCKGCNKLWLFGGWKLTKEERDVWTCSKECKEKFEKDDEYYPLEETYAEDIVERHASNCDWAEEHGAYQDENGDWII